MLRGAGTSLSGGALPLADGVLLGMGKFNRVLEIDYANRCARVQPGVTNLGITKAVEADGFYYAPDPSSQIACTIGGNVAENSGGVHCLKYGVTTNNVLGIEFVTLDGEVLRLGGKHLDTPPYDLLGLITGSEGLLGIVTEVTVRILRRPEVAEAMAEASQWCVDLAELQGRASELIAEATGAEAGYVTAGASAPEVLVEEILDAFAARYTLNVETVSGAGYRVQPPVSDDLSIL